MPGATPRTLPLHCAACGRVDVSPSTAELHHNRHDGFRLLQAPCPGCGDVVLTTDPAAIELALLAGVRRWELLPTAPPLTDEDATRLRAALDAGWPWEAGGRTGETDGATGSPPTSV